VFCRSGVVRARVHGGRTRKFLPGSAPRQPTSVSSTRGGGDFATAAECDNFPQCAEARYSSNPDRYENGRRSFQGLARGGWPSGIAQRSLLVTVTPPSGSGRSGRWGSAWGRANGLAASRSPAAPGAASTRTPRRDRHGVQGVWRGCHDFGDGANWTQGSRRVRLHLDPSDDSGPHGEEQVGVQLGGLVVGVHSTVRHPSLSRSRYHICIVAVVSSADVIRAVKRDGWSRGQGEGITSPFQASDEARDRYGPAPEEGHPTRDAREYRASSRHPVEVDHALHSRSDEGRQADAGGVPRLSGMPDVRRSG